MALREAGADGAHPVGVGEVSALRVLPDGDDGGAPQGAEGGALEEVVEAGCVVGKLLLVAQAVCAELHRELADVLGAHVGEEDDRALQRAEDERDAREGGEHGDRG